MKLASNVRFVVSGGAEGDRCESRCENRWEFVRDSFQLDKDHNDIVMMVIVIYIVMISWSINEL